MKLRVNLECRHLARNLGVADSTGQQFRRHDPLRKYVDKILLIAADAREPHTPPPPPPLSSLPLPWGTLRFCST